MNRALGRRLLWVFLLTICFAVMLVQMTDRVRHYLSEPVAVQVSVARNTSLTYPAITICNKVQTRTHAQWGILHLMRILNPPLQSPLPLQTETPL